MRALLTLVFATLLSFPAFAAPAIDEAGATALKPRFQQAIDQMAASMQKSGITMERAGDLMVEPAGTYYAVTSPNITLKMPAGITRTVGMVAINAIPTEDPDVFKVAVALPTPMIDADASGNNVGSLSFGSQTMNGLWNMKVSTFVEMNGSYKNVRLVNNAQGIDMSIPSLTLTSKLTQNGKFWQGPSEAVLSNVSHKDGVGSYQAGNLRIRTDVRELDFNAQPNSSGSSMGLSAAQSVIADFLTRYANAADVTVVADNVAFQGARNGTLKSASLQATLSNLRSKAADAVWTLGMDGVALDDPAAQRYVPSRVAFKGAGKKLPLENLVRVGEGGSYMKVLADAGSDIKIENLMLDAPAYGVDANGNVVASTTSPLGATGDMNVKVRGVQELNSWLATPDAARVLGVESIPQQLVATLAIVQLTGKDGTDSAGRPTKDFALQITPAGKMTLNGADMSALSGALGGGQLGGVMGALGKGR